jgi:hypothetical protein
LSADKENISSTRQMLLSWDNRVWVQTMKLLVFVVVLSLISLAGCASPQTTANMSNHIVDAIPHWMGGEPNDVPPRPGTPEYDASQAARAKEAARIKNGTPPAH